VPQRQDLDAIAGDSVVQMMVVLLVLCCLR